ncbi:MAG: hypothetical protein N2C14_11405 [Planctomycetales bacterium]
MTALPHLSAEETRSLASQTFIELGADPERVADVKDTILIQDGHYRGRSFRVEGMLAMWMIEVDLLQFYAADGELLKTISLKRRASESKAA